MRKTNKRGGGFLSGLSNLSSAIQSKATQFAKSPQAKTTAVIAQNTGKMLGNQAIKTAAQGVKKTAQVANIGSAITRKIGSKMAKRTLQNAPKSTTSAAINKFGNTMKNASLATGWASNKVIQSANKQMDKANQRMNQNMMNMTNYAAQQISK